uniref:Uncharacterized protein n=1 Tax=Romanomermis culicivorax TaxID=13658 RepID=A0A915JS74_ROMCU
MPEVLLANIESKSVETSIVGVTKVKLTILLDDSRNTVDLIQDNQLSSDYLPCDAGNGGVVGGIVVVTAQDEITESPKTLNSAINCIIDENGAKLIRIYDRICNVGSTFTSERPVLGRSSVCCGKILTDPDGVNCPAGVESHKVFTVREIEPTSLVSPHLSFKKVEHKSTPSIDVSSCSGDCTSTAFIPVVGISSACMSKSFCNKVGSKDCRTIVSLIIAVEV